MIKESDMFSNRFEKLMGGALAIVVLLALSTLAIAYFSSSTVSAAESQALVDQGQSTAPVNSFVLQTLPCIFGDDIGIDIRKNAEGVDSQTIPFGGTAIFEIVVTNCGGGLDLTSFEVTDADVPACDFIGGPLEVDESFTYFCSALGVTATFTNIAVATGRRDGKPDVEDQDPSTVVVEPPGDCDAARARINSFNLELTGVPSATPPFEIEAFDGNKNNPTSVFMIAGVNVGNVFGPIEPAAPDTFFDKMNIRFTVTDSTGSVLTSGLEVHVSCSDDPEAGVTTDTKDGVTFLLESFATAQKSKGKP